MKKPILTAVVLALLGASAWAANVPPTVTVYKSSACGCCGKWVEHMRASGFKIVTQDMNDLTPQKRRLGVPLAMGSCHTAEIAGYFIEGHVPAEDVKRLLAERPQAKGLVSPGMPQAAPGMDDARAIPYEVLLVRADGSTGNFAHH